MPESREILRGGLAATAAATVALAFSPAMSHGDTVQESLHPAQTTSSLGRIATAETADQSELTDADKLRAQLTKERAAWQAERRKLVTLAYAKRPVERTALQLAHATYGVPINGLIALASCESGRDPNAQNKTALSGSKATGYAQILYSPSGRRSSTWHTTPYARMSPKDLTTNILAAGYIWRRNDHKSHPGFGEWRDICARRADAASSGGVRITFNR